MKTRENIRASMLQNARATNVYILLKVDHKHLASTLMGNLDENAEKYFFYIVNIGANQIFEANF